MKLLMIWCVFHIANSSIVLLLDSLVKFNNRTQTLLYFFCCKKDAVLFLQHFSREYQVNVLPTNTKDLPYPIPSSYIAYILDGNCVNTDQLLFEANKSRLFSVPFKWIIYFNSGLIEDINEQYFSKYDILVDSDVTLAIKTNEDYSIFKIFKKHVDSNLEIENIGVWNRTGFIDNGFEKITYKRRRNLMKTVLKSSIVITNNDSLNHLTDKRDIHIDSIAKVDYILMYHLADTVNAILNYTIEGTWGYKDNNSKWNGMVGKLTRKEADIGGTALFMTVDRIDFIDYIAMVTPTRSKFVFRQPKLSFVANVYALPFNGKVWVSTLVLGVLTGFLLWFAVKWEWRKQKYAKLENTSNETEIRNSWLEVFFETFAAVCQQGTSTVPFSVSGRIILIFILITYMFLYTSYSANIVALLQSSATNIQTLKDILHSRLEVGVDNTVFNRFYFPTATEPVRRAIYEQKVAPAGQKPKFYKIREGVEKVRQGLFAFHVETGPCYKFVSEIFQEHEKCDLHEIQFLQVSDPWMAIQKNSSYKKMLTVGLRLLQENGIQDREVGLIYTKKPQCLSKTSSFISVGLVDCYFAAEVLAGGIASAVFVLILEIYVNQRLQFYRRWRKRRLERRNKIISQE